MDLQQALDVLGRVGAGEAFSLSELTDARDTIARHLPSLRGSGSPDLDALTTLRESYFAIDAAVQAVSEEQEQVAGEVEAALSDIPNPDEGEGDDEDPDDEEDPEEDDSEKSSSPKKGKMLSVQEAVARLGLSSTVQVNEPEKDLSATQTRVIMNGTPSSKEATLYDVAEAFRDASSRSLKTGKERVVRIETSFDEARTLSGKIGSDTRLVDSFVSPEAVTAAGGCCSLPQPIYSNPVQGST